MDNADKKKLVPLTELQRAYLQALKTYQICDASDKPQRIAEFEQARKALTPADRIPVNKILQWMLNDDSCIGGMACPNCGHTTSFIIEVPILLEFNDDGEMMDEPHCDRAWEDGSYCRCPECEHQGTVKDFLANCSECHGDGCELCTNTGRRHPAEGLFHANQP